MSFVGVNFSIHKEGFRFIAIGALATIVFSCFSSTLAWILFVLTLFCTFFFRNPKRTVPNDRNLIVAPADGTVVAVSLETPPAELGLGEEQRYRVSIFLSIFNVHINRLPVAGKVKNVIYQPGSFLNAALDKASVFNEKNTIVVEMNGEPDNLVAFSQIAGLIARRIVCEVHEGQTVNKGEIFGLIRFGSRSDVWLPVGSIPQVCVGQTMIGGETVLSDVSLKKGALRESSVI
ncbi:MAG: phosphatidylserine decarboxylase [Alphaproteobacteria bacterium]|nr:phosphatidylserine decarboxylase [Alphaproteobacteria bacterium]